MEETKLVKVWHRDSVHPEYELALDRKNQLDEDTKVVMSKIKHKRAGFVVKIWLGKEQPAPQPKIKTEDRGLGFEFKAKDLL
jgi:hypothetical protein